MLYYYTVILFILININIIILNDVCVENIRHSLVKFPRKYLIYHIY